jgi:predicted RNA-binding protein associated with RNAse of E/G family
MFAPGEIVQVRHVQRDQFGGLLPMRVVQHRPDGLLLWAPTGTRGWHLDMPDGRTMVRTPLAEWSATRRVPVPHTVNHGLLSWHPPGRDYSIRWFFAPDGRFRKWYANLEAPAVAWRDPGVAGIDTVDWDLDVVVHPDRRWEWKDEDEFTARLAEPDAYWVDDADRVRAAGKAVVALVEAGVFPFDGTWCDFRPDPSWPPLPVELPAGWDRPPC